MQYREWESVEDTVTQTKARRQRAIAELIRTRSIGSQEELAEMLAASGHPVAQATISRDLEEIGAVKIRRQGGIGYSMPDEINASRWAGSRLRKILHEWVRSIEPAGNLIVIKTPPGSAHLVGAALDQAELPDLVGTVSGDDTLFLAIRDASKGASFAAKLKDLASSGG